MKRYLVVVALLGSLVLGWFWIGQTRYDNIFTEPKATFANMEITSSAFQNNQRIPDEYTCKGSNINPPLEFKNIPEEAQSLVLMIEDPDAPMGTWDHWLVFNIEPDADGVIPDSIPIGGTQVVNSFGKPEYGGPCPPPGSTHRYIFKLYALDTMLDPEVVEDKPSLLTAMKNHVLATSELIGTFSR